MFFLLSWGTIGLVLFTIVFFGLKDFIYSIYAEKAPLLNKYYYYFYPITVFILYYGILESYVIMHNKPVVPTFIKEVLTRFLLAAGLIAIGLKIISFGSFVFFVLLIYLIGLIILTVYTHKLDSLLVTPNFSLYRDSSMFKEIRRFGLFIFLANGMLSNMGKGKQFGGKQTP